MTRVYIAGPMSGIKDFNFPAFNEAAKRLRSLGYEVENPADNPEQDSWGAYMRVAIPQMLTCEAIMLLPGWADSKGASLEAHIAAEMGMTRLYL
jgi:uncharacterized protein DUF4406